MNLGQTVPEACSPSPVLILATEVDRLDRVGATGDLVTVSYEARGSRNLLLLNAQGPVRTASISGTLGAIAASAVVVDGAWSVAFQHHLRTGAWTVYASGLDLGRELDVSEAAPVTPPGVPSFHPLLRAGLDGLQVFYRANARLETAAGTIEGGFSPAQSLDAPAPVSLLETVAVDALDRSWVAARGSAGVLFMVHPRDPSASGALRVERRPWLTADGDGVLVSGQLSEGPVVVDRYTGLDAPPARWTTEVVPSGEAATAVTRGADGSVWLGWQSELDGAVSVRQVGPSGGIGSVLELDPGTTTSSAAQGTLEAASTGEGGWMVWYRSTTREIRGAQMGCP